MCEEKFIQNHDYIKEDYNQREDHWSRNCQKCLL